MKRQSNYSEMLRLYRKNQQTLKKLEQMKQELEIIKDNLILLTSYSRPLLTDQIRTELGRKSLR